MIEMANFEHKLLMVDYLPNEQRDLNSMMNLLPVLKQLIEYFVIAMDHFQRQDCWMLANLTNDYLLNYNYLGYANEIDLKHCHRTMVIRNQNGIFSFLIMLLLLQMILSTNHRQSSFPMVVDH